MLYRNQTNAMSQIQALGRMRITTVPEAVAYLRIQSTINTQIAQVLQTASIRMQSSMQAPAQPQPVVKEPTVAPEQTQAFEAEDLASDEGFSESEIDAKVEKLKKAKTK